MNITKKPWIAPQVTIYGAELTLAGSNGMEPTVAQPGMS